MWATRGGFSEKLLTGLREPMPAGSKTDLPLAKTKSISNSGSASGITDLTRRAEHYCTIASTEE